MSSNPSAEERDDRYYRLTASDIRKFDKEATTLVIEMGEAGWVGRKSSGGHAIMRAPDGVTTASVSRDSLRGRSGRNARSVFTRWQKEQERVGTIVSLVDDGTDEKDEYKPDRQLLEFVDRALKAQQAVDEAIGETIRRHPAGKAIEPDPPGDTSLYKCPECGREFERPQSVGVHRRAKHGYVSANPKSVSQRKNREAAKKPAPVDEHPEITRAAQTKVDKELKRYQESWVVSLEDLIGATGVQIVQDRLDALTAIGLTWEVRMHRA